MLIDGGAGPKSLGGCYGSALHAASSCCSFKIVLMLLEKGADPNQHGPWGSAIFLARKLYAYPKRFRKEVVQMLLDHGAIDSE